MLKKTSFKTLAVSVVTLLLFGAVGAYSVSKDKVQGELVTEVKGGEMKVKLLSKSTNSNGQSYVVYSFEVTPDYATDKSIEVKSLGFTNQNVNDSPSSYIDVSINNNEFTFTVTHLKDFANQISITLAYVAAEDVTALLTIDCKQKWLGFTDKTEYEYYNSASIIKFETVESSIIPQLDGGYSDTYTIELEKSQASVVNRVTVGAYEAYSNSLTGDYIVTQNDILTTEDQELSIFKSMVEKYTNGNQFSFNDTVSLKSIVNSTWSDQKKLQIKEYKYYGFCLEQDITFELYGETNVIRLKTYLSYYVSGLSLTIIPTGLTVENGSIIF